MPNRLDPRVTQSRVRGLGVPRNRKQARQVRQQAAERVEQREGFRDVDPQGDLEVNDTGLSLLEEPRREAAANRFQDAFPEQTLTKSNVQQADDGFAPTETVRRRGAANEFEDNTLLSEVDPQEDVTQTEGDGFALDTGAQKEIAATQLDDEFADVGIGTGDVQQESGGGFGLTRGARREVAAERFEDQTAAEQLDPQEDISLVGGEPQLTDAGQRQVGAALLDDQIPSRDVGEEDVLIEDDEVVLDDGVFR